MKLLALIIVTIPLLVGCQMMNPRGDTATAAGEKRASRDALAAFESLFGHPLPKGVSLDGNNFGTFYDRRRLTQVRAGAKVPRSVFRSSLHTQAWREIPIPCEYLSEIHLPSSVPKNIMTCYTGHVNGHRFDLLWSDDAETAMIILDY